MWIVKVIKYPSTQPDGTPIDWGRSKEFDTKERATIYKDSVHKHGGSAVIEKKGGENPGK